MLSPPPCPPIPTATARIARAAFPQGHPHLAADEALGAVCTAAACAALFPRRGQPARPPWRLALTTIRRFAAGRADRQAADALRGRIDWQDVLRLDRADVGCDAAVLCAFRGRLLAGEAAWLLCETLLAWARAAAAHGAGPAVHRRDARPGGRACPEPGGGEGGDAAPRPRCCGRRCPRLAAYAVPSGVGGG